MIALGILFALHVLVEIIRISKPETHAKLIMNWRWLLRESERTGPNAAIYFLMSCLIAVAVFPKLVAVLAILCLAVGDPAASLAGVLWGKYSPKVCRGKSLVGTLACGVVCAAAIALLLNSVNATLPVATLSILGGAAAAVAECLPLGIDDNLTMPLLTGAAFWIILRQ